MGEISPPEEEEKLRFFHELKQCIPLSGILLAVEKRPQAGSTRQPQLTVAEKQSVKKLPPLLSTLYSSKYAAYDEVSLKKECEKIFNHDVIEVGQSESKYLEEQTRLQSQSPLWFQHRVGRITASKFGAVSRAKVVKPTCFLANTMMQERSFDSSKVPSLNWGIINESVARDVYLQRESSKHNNLMYQPSGLHVHRHYSYLTASPDGLISVSAVAKAYLRSSARTSLGNSTQQK